MIYFNPFSSQVTIETQFMDDTMEMSDFSTLMDEVLAMDKTPTAEAEYKNLTKCLNTNLTDLIAQMMPTMEDDKVNQARYPVFTETPETHFFLYSLGNGSTKQ